MLYRRASERGPRSHLRGHRVIERPARGGTRDHRGDVPLRSAAVPDPAPVPRIAPRRGLGRGRQSGVGPHLYLPLRDGGQPPRTRRGPVASSNRRHRQPRGGHGVRDVQHGARRVIADPHGAPAVDELAQPLGQPPGPGPTVHQLGVEHPGAVTPCHRDRAGAPVPGGVKADRHPDPRRNCSDRRGLDRGPAPRRDPWRRGLAHPFGPSVAVGASEPGGAELIQGGLHLGHPDGDPIRRVEALPRRRRGGVQIVGTGPLKVSHPVPPAIGDRGPPAFHCGPQPQ